MEEEEGGASKVAGRWQEAGSQLKGKGGGGGWRPGRLGWHKAGDQAGNQLGGQDHSWASQLGTQLGLQHSGQPGDHSLVSSFVPKEEADWGRGGGGRGV